MNEITPLTQTPARMSSQEIADLVGCRHDNVKRTIERLAKQDVIRLPPLEDTGKLNHLGLNSSYSVYVFDIAHKLDSITVIARLSRSGRNQGSDVRDQISLRARRARLFF
jgi:phage regulator Rha-like protein